MNYLRIESRDLKIGMQFLLSCDLPEIHGLEIDNRMTFIKRVWKNTGEHLVFVNESGVELYLHAYEQPWQNLFKNLR